MKNKNIRKWDSFGIWHVTTENDCEGRSSRSLGIFTGHIDDIAFALADKQYYSLYFKKVDPKDIVDMSPKGDTVNVTLDIESGIWDFTPDERIEYFEDMFSRAGRTGVNVSRGGSYASVNLTKKSALTPEQKMINRLKEAGFDPSEVINTFKQR